MFKLKEGKQPVGEVIVDSFRLIGHTWAANIIVVLMAIVFGLILGSIFGAITASTWTQIITATKTMHGNDVMNVIVAMPSTRPIVITLIGLFLFAWFYKICNAIIVRSCWNMATSGKMQLGRAFAIGFKYFYVYFIQLLVVIAVSVAMYVIQYLFAMLQLHWVDVVVTILTQLVIYYIAVKLVLVDASAVIDECGIKGFSHAWSYTSGNWWRTLGSLVFSFLFYGVFLYVMGVGIVTLVLAPGVAPTLSSHFMTGLAAHATPMWIGGIISVFGIVTILSMIFTLPTMLAGNQALIYHDLKHRH